MSTMRYIGARYVPKWYVNSVDQTSNWEVNVEYEPLTWVTTQNNHLYLSKKTVPDNIGTPAQNTAYWLDMGQMTGDLQNIQDEIDAIVANMGDLSDLTTTDKSSLVAAINEAAQSGGGGGGTQYDDVDSYYWLIISDSYAMYPTESTSWADLLVTKMGIASGNYSILRVNGGGFGNGLFTSALNAVTITTSKPIKIVVCGGFNDGTYITQTHTLTDLTNAIEAFNTAALAKFPKAKIYVGFIAYEKNSIGVARSNKEALYTAMYAYKRCTRFGMRYLTNVEHAMRAFTLLDSTGFHPNASGAELICEAVYNALLAGSATIIPLNVDLTSYISFGGGTVQRGTVRAIRNNGVCTLLIQNLFVTNVSIPISNTTAVLFTADDNHGLFSGSSNCRGTLRGSVVINNVTETEPGMTCVYNQNRLTAISSHAGTITAYILDGSLTFGSDTFDSNETTS